MPCTWRTFKDETGVSPALVYLHVTRLEADDAGVTWNIRLNSVPVCQDCYLLTLVLMLRVRPFQSLRTGRSMGGKLFSI